MPKGLVSQIYAFETTDRNFDDPFAEGLYSTASAGVLTGLKGYKMYLSNDHIICMRFLKTPPFILQT
mgnify:CR=1 FL=1